MAVSGLGGGVTAVTDEPCVPASPAQPCAQPGTADTEIGAADVYSATVTGWTWGA